MKSNLTKNVLYDIYINQNYIVEVKNSLVRIFCRLIDKKNCHKTWNKNKFNQHRYCVISVVFLKPNEKLSINDKNVCFYWYKVKLRCYKMLLCYVGYLFTFSLDISFIFWRWEVSISEVFTVFTDKDSVWWSIEMSSGGSWSDVGLFSL